MQELSSSTCTANMLGARCRHGLRCCRECWGRAAGAASGATAMLGVSCRSCRQRLLRNRKVGGELPPRSPALPGGWGQAVAVSGVARRLVASWIPVGSRRDLAGFRLMARPGDGAAWRSIPESGSGARADGSGWIGWRRAVLGGCRRSGDSILRQVRVYFSTFCDFWGLSENC